MKMRNRTVLAVWLLVLAIGILLVACQPDSTPADTADPTDTPTHTAAGSPTDSDPHTDPDTDPVHPSEPTETPDEPPLHEPTESAEESSSPSDGQLDEIRTDSDKQPTEAPIPIVSEPPEAPTEAPAETPTEAPTEAPTESPDEPQEGYQVGDLCYDTTLHLYDGASFTVSDGLGYITILNFWGSWCGPCRNELPAFDRVAEEYADSVIVVAIHSEYGMEQGDAYIVENYSNSSIRFAFDPNDTYYDLLAQDNVWPITVVLDQNGVIRYRCRGAMTESQLRNIITNLLPW